MPLKRRPIEGWALALWVAAGDRGKPWTIEQQLARILRGDRDRGNGEARCHCAGCRRQATEDYVATIDNRERAFM